MKLIFSITTISILVGSLIISLGSCVQLDIHLKLRPSSCLYQIALAANDELLLQNPATECISFHNDTVTAGSSLPHVTLYLSDFLNDSLSNITNVLKYLILKRRICQPARTTTTTTTTTRRRRISNSASGPPPPAVDIDHVMIQGSYSMYHISKTYFLQHLSDEIVMNSHSFIIPNQTIPEWVYNLPEPERSIKIDYVGQYGSPNVLDEFDPHMTVGYDEYTPSVNRQKTLEECLSRFISNKNKEECLTGRGNQKIADKGIHWEIAVGLVGDWGTVLKDLWVMKLKECKDDHHELLHTGRNHVGADVTE